MAPELVVLVLVVGGIAGAYIFRKVLLKALIVAVGLAVMIGIGYVGIKYYLPGLSDKTVLTISAIAVIGGGLSILKKPGS